MGILFHWFKNYKITHDEYHGYLMPSVFRVAYIDGCSTTYSARSVLDIDAVFEQYGGAKIPSIYEELIQSTSDDLGLIQQSKMAQICDNVLTQASLSADLRERIEWFKDLSDAGYYIAYEP